MPRVTPFTMAYESPLPLGHPETFDASGTDSDIETGARTPLVPPNLPRRPETVVSRTSTTPPSYKSRESGMSGS